MFSSKFRGVGAGEQLGNLEYLIDDRVLAEYRALVGNCASYANLIADDCESMMLARFGDAGFTVVWRRFDFLRPPVPGRRVQAGGWLKEVRERAGLPWLRVSAFAVDEIGTEILRCEAAFTVGVAKAHPQRLMETRRNASTNQEGCSFTGLVGDSFLLGQWDLPSGERLSAQQQLRRELSGVATHADENGDTQLLAGWLEGQLAQRLGDDFRWGGQLALAYRRSTGPGERISADAVVVAHDTDPNGTRAIRLSVGAYNERNEPIAVGEASATIPSPRLL